VLFVFGADYAPAFLAANRRAAAARGRPSGARRSLTLAVSPRPSRGLSAAPGANSPINKSAADPSVLMGEFRSAPAPLRGNTIQPSASAPDSPLEAALERLRKAAGWQGPPQAAAGRDS
jgi:hypothetical protein